ncbi:hypothetical protein BHE74_00052736 [Ensete ventricosum]|nr:hypothetical protein BHE74_00052736 [Ensete ventricosum]
MTVLESPRALDEGTITTNTESPEGRLKTLDLRAEILIDQDSEWEEAEDIRPAGEIIEGKREGMKVDTISVAGAGDDEEIATITKKKHPHAE